MAEKALSSITSSVREINEMNTQITLSADKQYSVSERINRNIEEINKLGYENASGAEQTAMANQSLVFYGLGASKPYNTLQSDPVG